MCLGSAGVALRMTTHLVLQPLITDQCLTGGGGWGVQAGNLPFVMNLALNLLDLKPVCSICSELCSRPCGGPADTNLHRSRYGPYA